MKKSLYTILTLITITGFTFAQVAPAAKDTVVVDFGQLSNITFLIGDRDDLQDLQKLDLNEIANTIVAEINLAPDSVAEIEVEDSIRFNRDEHELNRNYSELKIGKYRIVMEDGEIYSDKNERRDNTRYRHHNRPRHVGTSYDFNIDLGINNYLENGTNPDAFNAPYAVRPWGSWYVALASINKTAIAGPLFLQWGGSISWYNFKFEDNAMRVARTPDGLVFEPEMEDYQFSKSKLTVPYLNLSLIPMLDFSYARRTFTDDNGNTYKKTQHVRKGFRIGAGPYAGYRIGGYTKVKYDDGNTQRQRNHDSYYLNNLRYGMRLQMGYRGVDIFANYDMNNLFADGRGPEVNAFSFGITF